MDPHSLKNSPLWPRSKIYFYDDPYGETLIHEIVAIKKSKNNLESIVFNHSKIWMTYTPGTKAFVPAYDYWDPTVTRDSSLRCSLVFVPDTWSNLIWLTDNISSSLFKNISLDNFVIFKDLIRCCLRDSNKFTACWYSEKSLRNH